jgi:hypothetical protein
VSRYPQPDAQREHDVQRYDDEVEGVQIEVGCWTVKSKGAAQRLSSPGHPPSLFIFHRSRGHAVKLVPHPHPPVAFGLLKVKPDPCIEVT